MLQKLERHDILNAAALAGVLFVLLLGATSLAGQLTNDGEPLWTGVKDTQLLDPPEDFAPEGLAPNTVSVRVANGAENSDGLAGDATEILLQFNYGAVDPVDKDGNVQQVSKVYYLPNYRASGIDIGRLLHISESNVRPAPRGDINSLGVSFEGVDVVVILGNEIS